MSAHHGRKGSSLPTLLAGIVIGLLGSVADDVLGSSGFVSVLQVILWVVAAVLIAGALLGMLRPAPRPGGTAPA